MSQPAITLSWHVSLIHSVQALGAAARELRAAHSLARQTAWTADPTRIVQHHGTFGVTGTDGSALPVRPHEEALWQLSDLYMVLEHHTRELYENAALGYAYGAAQAVTAVLRGERPATVELTRDPHGHYAHPADGLPDVSQSLTVEAGARELDRLRGQFLTCLDTDNGDSSESARDGADLADAAHLYGKQAERTLDHLIRFADAHGFLQAG
jgi:hypothetical protein